PPKPKGYLPFAASRMKTTLENYYAKRRREHAAEYPDFCDSDLKKVCDCEPGLSRREYGAGRSMLRSRKMIVQSVSEWTAESKFTVNSLVKKLITRCEELDLKVGKSEAQTCLDVAAYLASLVTHYLFTGKFKRTV